VLSVFDLKRRSLSFASNAFRTKLFSVRLPLGYLCADACLALFAQRRVSDACYCVRKWVIPREWLQCFCRQMSFVFVAEILINVLALTTPLVSNARSCGRFRPTRVLTCFHVFTHVLILLTDGQIAFFGEILLSLVFFESFHVVIKGGKSAYYFCD